MPHISYSELKNWTMCPHYRKLVNEDKLNPLTDSIFTTFGTAVHSVCEEIAHDRDWEICGHMVQFLSSE